MFWSGNHKKKRGSDIQEMPISRKRDTGGRWQRIGKTVLLLLLVGGAGYGAWWGMKLAARKLFAENSRFAVTRIVVENKGDLLSAPQVIQSSGAKAGQNLFAIELAQMRRDIELLPIVERAEVRRDLPDTLTLRITERTPVLRFAVYFQADRGGTKKEILYLDKYGYVVSVPPAAVSRFTKLPWLTGLRAGDIRAGKKISSPQAADVLKLLAAWETAPASVAFGLTQIDVSRPNQIALVSSSGTVAVLAPADFQPQLARMAVILADAREKRKVVRLADLTVKQNVPVTFRN